MSRTRLINKTGAGRMIAKTRLNKRTRGDSAQRLIAEEAPCTLAIPATAQGKPSVIVQRPASGWGHGSRAEREAQRRKAARESLRSVGESEPAPIRPLTSPR